MEIDYSPYLHVLPDGSIWWRLGDAVKLGAGYLPVRDDEINLNPILIAKNNRVRANERNLLSEFSRGHYTEAHPRLVVRDDGRYVEAHEFLEWLSQHITITQSAIPFPNDLIRAVRLAGGPPVARTRAGYESLSGALEGYFDQSFDELPDAQRERVRRDFFPIPWDSVTPDQRRVGAMQWDYQHDPATEQEREFWWQFFLRKDAIEEQIKKWKAVATPTAADLARQETRLAELERELARMERQEKQPGNVYFPQRTRSDSGQETLPVSQDTPDRYVAYPKAMKLLADRLGATPDELAAWLFYGPEQGGLAAYLNANELDPPPRFYYSPGREGDFDYVSQLMGCWFIAEEIANFQPTYRYITGKSLIERWGEQSVIQPKAFILAKIRESRLADCHPTYGGTEATFSGIGLFPPLETGLFALSQVEGVEKEDFGKVEARIVPPSAPCQAVAAWQIRHRFLIIKDEDANEKWWKNMMQDAKRNGLASCRVGTSKTGPTGSLWRPDLIAGWLVDRHAKGRDGLSSAAARVALKKFPGCEEVAEELFPPEEVTNYRRELP